MEAVGVPIDDADPAVRSFSPRVHQAEFKLAVLQVLTIPS